MNGDDPGDELFQQHWWKVDGMARGDGHGMGLDARKIMGMLAQIISSTGIK